MNNPYTAYSAADTSVDSDNKPRILLKVYQSMLDKIDMVKGAIDRKNFEKKYDELTKLTTVLDILDSSLDMSQGEVAKNLSDLYHYLTKRLKSVHITHDMTVLEECKAILVQLDEGFKAAYEKETKGKVQGNSPENSAQKNSIPFSHRTV
ncbi:MAG TPA: flagellar export chaperone FliS [Syntrophorhabdaceae bacterium]|jgi:flagellar protein FliS